MEDQEIRILESYCDEYAKSRGEGMQSPVEYLLAKPRESHAGRPGEDGVCGSYEDVSSQSVHLKLFAQVLDKRVWKRRLLLVADAMVLVMKRPDDHYLKNVIPYAEFGPAVAYVSRKEVVPRERSQVERAVDGGDAAA